MKNSKVILVGAGPGDKDLITLKGIKAIMAADIIFYDALVNPELLEYASSNTPCIYVGKRRDKKRYSQEEINSLLADATKTHHTVVRLKGGDPFVFGRGSEELNHLDNLGISTEIIPGISSALAVPANQGIPLTKRGLNESFSVITGTTSKGTVSKDLKYAAMSSATIVLLMGLKNLAVIMKETARYRDHSTPFAVIQNGTRPDESIHLDTIGNFESVIDLIDYSKPGIIVIGETVSEHPAFFEEEIQRVLQAVL
ncbi:uroporphyrinogen-III C-methyltransferase [Lutimonas sp.]|uniref:uroporphyrinogen-III C-methyltransferase n=1 Tax=Lutimonas sp. TaxID=1872403 RepID=UPI003D9AC10B